MKPISNKKLAEWSTRVVSWEIQKGSPEHMAILFARELERARVAIRRHRKLYGMGYPGDEKLYRATLPEGEK